MPHRAHNKVSLEIVQERLHQAHGDKVKLDELTYTGMRAKARFIDIEHGEWYASVASVLGGHGNPTRGIQSRVKKRSLSIVAVQDRVLEASCGLVTLDVDTYVNVHTKARFIDQDYGEWLTTPIHVFQGHLHPCRARRNTTIKQSLSLDTVLERIKQRHGDLVELDVSTYPPAPKSKSRFIDRDFGEWRSYARSVISGRGHPQRGQLNRVCSARHSQTLVHWATQKSVVCVASYEIAFVNWCNANRIDFDWQVPIQTTLLTPTGKPSVYFIDAYIKSGEFANTYVELKGTWNRKNGHVGKAKWEWFHSGHPNSQLWSKLDLKRLGIL